MGFKKIFLCGQGYTYDPQYMLHFYDNINYPTSLNRSEAIKKIKGTILARRKRGGTIYYGGLNKQDDLFRAICKRNRLSDNRSHLKLKKFANEHGVEIYNIVPDGFSSSIYKRISCNDFIFWSTIILRPKLIA